MHAFAENLRFSRALKKFLELKNFAPLRLTKKN
jgi:hypothetical protein